MSPAATAGKPSFLMISGHDYRTKRKANVHFIADELAVHGKTRVFSIGFSWLSKIKNDPRMTLLSRANQVESFGAVEAYLWKSLLHPINLGRAALSPISEAWFKAYARRAPDILHQWIRDSDTIIIESGMGVIFFDLIKTIHPKARIVYLCSDALETIGCAPFLTAELKRAAPLFDGICVPSKLLATEFDRKDNVFYAPHGLDATGFEKSQSSPYGSGTHLVSVGSMLFDNRFFEIAADTFPEFSFHVIGGGKRANTLKAHNITVYDEMPFSQTIAYIKHASAGIAPYQGGKVAPYLQDTSMKLMQFSHLGIPAVCPNEAVGSHKGRFGYEPDNRSSIADAIKRAVSYGHFEGVPMISWKDVVDRILDPSAFTDTQL